ncbi:hypothetical protein ORI20_29860 [Mycobacterium sp. CVI_P3]|uniref:Uncharacterized protein n=1 Tax=Mycobacterium pinniadriaticum TaxID=2994102 RepID=A0ABT3SPT5_9MYCO|nr:hypothetical protein [Mycobacterium pinniadriaticum]MCX2934477.1 hypothetical protein [Mycobacterium pinniadriaticum]MCX2940900.1 hypothetical protein [Mycobacterium pinniadriaticum]
MSWCRAQAEQIGPGAVAIVAELSTINAIHRLRAIQGIIRFRERYGDARLDPEQSAEFVDGQGNQILWGVLDGALGGGGHDEERVREHGQRDPPVPGGPPADLVFTPLSEEGAALVLACRIRGNAEASATRSASTPRTRRRP